MKNARVRLAVCVGAAVASLFGLGRSASAQQTVPASGFFDWNATTEPAPTNFTASPFLDNNAASAAQVSAVLASAQAQGHVLAIKVRQPLTDPAAIAVFNSYAVKYVFADYENAARTGFTRALADVVLASAKSSQAFVGNFNFYPNAGTDPTRPASLSGSQANSFTLNGSNRDYADSRGGLGNQVGNQIAAPALYPGSPDYRNPASGNSNAPNIRSALFTLPIQRLTLAELGIKGYSAVPSGYGGFNIATGANTGSQSLIPWVTRFNNYGNAALGGGPSGTGFVQNAATPSNGQLLSRGDFQAMILHYRFRGANSVNLFDASAGSVVGYSNAQEQSDVRTGWADSNTANQIFARGNYAFANLTNVVGDSNSIGVDNNMADSGAHNTESAGVVWSGVYDKAGTVDPTSGKRKMMLVLSNLSAVKKSVDLPNSLGGFTTYRAPGSGTGDLYDDFVIGAGQHRLLNFSLQVSTRGKMEWVFQGDSFIGLDNNRNGIGIPEPTTASLMGLAGFGLLARRRRGARA